MIEKYTKRPVIIEALQFTPSNYKECEAFIGKENYDNTLNYPNIKTPEGIMRVDEYDWIIKGVAGEFYNCKPEIFKRTYIKEEENDSEIKAESTMINADHELLSLVLRDTAKIIVNTASPSLKKYMGELGKSVDIEFDHEYYLEVSCKLIKK